MARFRWVMINGELVPADEVTANESKGPAILPDLPSFRSPIDGSVVSGRAGMRDHCARHNVVPTADLAGLPPKTMNTPYAPSAAERERTKQTIASIINSRNY